VAVIGSYHKEGTLKVEDADGEVTDCTAVLNANAETFVGVTLGKLDAGEAFSSGNIKVDGDLTVLVAILPKAFKPFKPVIKASAIVESVEERFRPEKAEGVDIKIGYDLSGDGGGQWTVVVKDQTCTLKEVLDDDCTVIMRMEAQVFVDLNQGKLDGGTAFSSGQVKVDGDIGVAGQSASLFEKYVAEGAAEEEGEELISLKCVPSINQRYATGPTMGKWFDGLKEKKFFASKCPQCGRTLVPPREICAQCRVRCNEFVEVGPDATVTLIDVGLLCESGPADGKDPRDALYGTFHGPGRGLSG